MALPVAIWKRAAVLLLLALTPLSACQASPAHDYAITDQRRPALWRVTDPVGGNSGYLFGTIHMLPEGVDWQTPALVRALAASDRLVKELGPDDGAPAMESILAVAMDEPVPPMKQRLPDDLYQQMLKLAEQQSLDAQALDHMESWAVSLLLARSQDSFLGIETRLGVDAVLEAKFGDAGRMIVGLDKASDQLARFDDLPPAIQDRLLALSIGDAGKSANMARDYERLVNNWLEGNVDRLAASKDGPFAIPEVRRALLTDPNAKWASEIGRMIRGGARPFVAVGSAHLGGKASLPALLAEQGLTVERIQ